MHIYRWYQVEGVFAWWLYARPENHGFTYGKWFYHPVSYRRFGGAK